MKDRFGIPCGGYRSSFFVACKTLNGIERDWNVLDALGIPRDSEGAKLFAPLIAFLAGGRWITADRIVDENDLDQSQYSRSATAKALDLVAQGWAVREVRASGDGGSGNPAETFFYDTTINLDTPTLKVFSRYFCAD